MRIVILGAPGAGKRTQSALLAEKLDLSIVTTGDLLKKAIAEETSWGMEAKALQDAGRVVTEDIILGLLREQLLQPEMADGFILDGFPRNLLQALTLDELLLEIGQPLDMVLLIDIDNDHLMERLVGRRTCRSCGQLYNAYRNPPIVDGVCDNCGGRLHQRSDDNEETVSSRIHVFDHLIAPLITHYDKSHRLVRVDGNGSLEVVFGHLINAIEEANTTTTPAAEKPADVADLNKLTPQTRSDKPTVIESVDESQSEPQGDNGKLASPPLKTARRPSKKSPDAPSKKSSAEVTKSKKRGSPKRSKAATAAKKVTPKRSKTSTGGESKQADKANKAGTKKTGAATKAAQPAKKRKPGSRSSPTKKVVKKSAAKRNKPAGAGKKAAQTKKKVSTKSRPVAKSSRKPTASKGKSSASRKKLPLAKKKVIKKKLTKKKQTVKKQLLKSAKKTALKGRSAVKRKAVTKKSAKVKAKGLKKTTHRAPLAKKASTRKSKSAPKKALKKKSKK